MTTTNNKLNVSVAPAGFITCEVRGCKITRPIYAAILETEQAFFYGYVGAGVSVSVATIAATETPKRTQEFIRAVSVPGYGSDKVARAFESKGWEVIEPNVLTLATFIGC